MKSQFFTTLKEVTPSLLLPVESRHGATGPSQFQGLKGAFVELLCCCDRREREGYSFYDAHPTLPTAWNKPSAPGVGKKVRPHHNCPGGAREALNSKDTGCSIDTVISSRNIYYPVTFTRRAF